MPLQHSTFKGSHLCGRHDCKTCAHVAMHTDFMSEATGKIFRTQVFTNFKTCNIIYLIEWHKCKIRYIGETENPLHLKMNRHRADYYQSLPDKLVVKHFNTWQQGASIQTFYVGFKSSSQVLQLCNIPTYYNVMKRSRVQKQLPSGLWQCILTKLS